MEEENSTGDLPLHREFVLNEPLGINSLPEQTMKKRMQQGFVFNILLIGETGIGKSTLICSLFNIGPTTSVKEHLNSEVQLKKHTYDLCEKGVNLKLSVTETVVYGDQLNRINDVEPIVNYIESQFETYFKEEMKVSRSLTVSFDTRIHACLYFICPTGHNLKSLDVFCMKKLQEKVNIIPIVAKSDCLSKQEINRFKLTINATLEQQNIKVYRFPAEDEETVSVDRNFSNIIPFAVAASEDYVLEGSPMRARIFPWGIMLVENEEHSEFIALKRALIESNMEDLREKTHNEYYECYRKNRMIEMGFTDTEWETLNFPKLLQTRRSKLYEEMSEQEENLKTAFVERVKAMEDDLKAQETAMRAKYDDLFAKLEEQQNNLIREQDVLEKDILLFKKKVNDRNTVMMKHSGM